MLHHIEFKCYLKKFKGKIDVVKPKDNFVKKKQTHDFCSKIFHFAIVNYMCIDTVTRKTHAVFFK